MAKRPVLIDLSGNGNDAQLYNFAWTVDNGIDENGELRFDGVTAYGSCSKDLGLVDDVTIIYKRTFFKPQKMTTGALFVTDNNVYNKSMFFLSHNNTTNGCSVRGKGVTNMIPAPLETAIEWYTPTKFKTESQTIEFDMPGTIIYDRTKSLLLGRNRMTANPQCIFAFETLLIFNRTLTDKEIEYVKQNMID